MAEHACVLYAFLTKAMPFLPFVSSWKTLTSYFHTLLLYDESQRSCTDGCRLASVALQYTSAAVLRQKQNTLTLSSAIELQLHFFVASNRVHPTSNKIRRNRIHENNQENNQNSVINNSRHSTQITSFPLGNKEATYFSAGNQVCIKMSQYQYIRQSYSSARPRYVRVFDREWVFKWGL